MSYPIVMSALNREDVEDIDEELSKAKRHGEKFASLHEAWAVIKEEVDEVWEITRQKKRDRDPVKLRHELIQVAAMCHKALQSMSRFTGGDV